MAFNFKSPGAAMSGALEKFLVEQEVKRRQSMLDGFLVEDRMRQQAKEDLAAQRQTQMDAIATEDRQRRIANDDRTYTDTQERQRVEDARYEAEQQQRAITAKDAAANRYLDTERGYYEAGQKRQFEAGEAARDRASQERRASASGRDTSKPTQGQLTADTFYARATDALDELEAVEGNISQFNAYVPNFLLSEDGQAYQQAKRQWVEAYLRKDSGAAIGKDEYANADRTYFVQPGDSAATVRRKQRAREKITDSIRTQGTGRDGQPRPMPSHGGGSGRDLGKDW